MNSNEVNALIDSYLADFHTSYLDHTDDLSQPVTYEQLDCIVSNLEATLKKCFSLVVDANK